MADIEEGAAPQDSGEGGNGGSFLTSFRGLIVAITGLVTALTGLLVLLNKAGILGAGSNGASSDTTPKRAATPSPR